MNYAQLYQDIQDYAENTESLFLANIPTFVEQAEQRIYNSVQIPSLRRNVTGAFSAGNQYVSLPSDWLSTFSFAVVYQNKYTYLLDKDVPFMREAYPNPATTGLPRYYSVFGPQLNNLNEMSLIVAPTPDQVYSTELHYYYYPITIVQGTISTTNTLVPGSGYSARTYNDIALTGGTGLGAKARITVVNSGVSAVTITNPGQFYVAGDVLSATFGGGTGFSIRVASVANPDGTSWLGINFSPVLFYGAMREAIIFMKGEQDMVAYYEQKYQEALAQLKRLGDGLERGDAYRDGQTRMRVNT
jgi:hypothetical protein